MEDNEDIETLESIESLDSSEEVENSNNVVNNENLNVNTKKKVPLPLLILIISICLGLVVAGVGLIKQENAKKTNKKRYDEAYRLANENKLKLEKKYSVILEEIETLNDQYESKKQECDSIVIDNDWYKNQTKCDREAININSKITKLEQEQFSIEHYDNTVYYNLVKPMSYQIFYIVGGCIAALGAIAAFIIYLVKGKKSYN